MCSSRLSSLPDQSAIALVEICFAVFRDNGNICVFAGTLDLSIDNFSFHVEASDQPFVKSIEVNFLAFESRIVHLLLRSLAHKHILLTSGRPLQLVFFLFLAAFSSASSSSSCQVPLYSRQESEDVSSM